MNSAVQGQSNYLLYNFKTGYRHLFVENRAAFFAPCQHNKHLRLIEMSFNK